MTKQKAISGIDMINKTALVLFDKHYIELTPEEEKIQKDIENTIYKQHKGEKMTFNQYLICCISARIDDLKRGVKNDKTI